jgi:hypothetical protein
MELPTNRTDFLIQIIAIFEANDWPRFKLYYSQALLIKDRFSLKSLKSGKKDKDSDDEVKEDVKEIVVVNESKAGAGNEETKQEPAEVKENVKEIVVVNESKAGAGNEETKQEPAEEFNPYQELMLSTAVAEENFFEELYRQNLSST